MSSEQLRDESFEQSKTAIPRKILFKGLCGVLAVLVVIGILLYPAYKQAREAQSRTHSRNKMKAIGQALLSYEESQQHFPEISIKDETGKPLLSWRVELLPYLGYQNLYDQFDLTQPWDSEINKKLISQMPDIFQCSEMDAGEFKTNYLLVVGRETVFTPEGTTRIGQIIDGTSNTVMAVEADESQAVTWTEPTDFNYDQEEPLKGFPQLRNGVTLFLMADGSVQVIDGNINEIIFSALMTKAGQEDFTTCVDLDEFE